MHDSKYFLNRIYAEVKLRVLKKENTMTSQDRLDIIIFGATGYTGKHVIKHLVTLSKEYKIKWGIAGRNLSALQAALKWASERTGDNLIEIPIVIADLANESTILTMAKKCKVVLDCVGPYTWYGEKVVKACIEGNSHFVDITGEPYFMEYIQYEYNEKAKEAGVYIVSACGYECLPTDIGVLSLQDNFEGQVNSIDCYGSFDYKGPKQKGAAVHTGTWNSAILIGKMEGQRKQIFNKIYPSGIKQFEPIPKPKGAIHKFGNKYCVNSIGPDHSVVLRSQQNLYEQQGRRPIVFNSYFSFPNKFIAWMIHISLFFFFIFSQYNIFCVMLSKFPKIFTFGFISEEGPKEEELQYFQGKIVLNAIGWENNANQKPKSKKLTIKCTDPGYGTTAKVLILAGVMLVKQIEHLPPKGGVYTPGALFYKTTIREELIKNGMSFEFDDSK